MENNLYQIAVPILTNAGVAYLPQITRFEEYVLRRCGGFTDEGQKAGVWMDPATTTVYREPMRWYSIMTSDADMKLITQAAFLLFPDQKAFFVAQIGTASVIETPAVVGGE